MKRKSFRFLICLFMVMWCIVPTLPALAGLAGEPVDDCSILGMEAPQPAEGKINKALVAGSKIAPAFICAQVAKTMDANSVALLAVAVPPKKAAAITRRLDREFVAEVTKYLDPVKSIPVINNCPDDLVADVVKILLKQGYAGITGRIADNLTAEKLIAVSDGLDLTEYIQVGCHMQQTHLIAKILAAKPDAFLIDLVEKCAELGYYRLVAQVVQEMDAKRVIDLLARLSMNKQEKPLFIAYLAPHLTPAKSNGIIVLCPDETVAAVVKNLIEQDHADITGRLADALTKDKLVAVSNRLTLSEIIQVGRHMSEKKLIADVLSDYSDDDLMLIFKEAARLNYGDLIADVIQVLKPERTKRILAGLTSDEIIDFLSGFDGPSMGRIIQCIHPSEIKAFADSLAAEKIAGIVSHSPPALINTMWPYFNTEKILTCLPLVDLNVLPGIWEKLNSSVQTSLVGMGNRYEPLAIAVQKLPTPRQ